jgi:hypothetical protein
MSATIAPPTKPYAGRPPITPPIETTFDGMGDDTPEPMHRQLAANVTRLLRSVATWPDEELPLLMRLLEQRTRMVEQALGVERMMDSDQLPPSAFGPAFAADFLGPQENEAVRTYLGLLQSLYDAILRTRRKIGLLKDLLPSSEG